MKKDLIEMVALDNHLGCFGNFDIEKTICRRLCILSLRCAIENEQKSRMEILEDLLSPEGLHARIQ